MSAAISAPHSAGGNTRMVPDCREPTCGAPVGPVSAVRETSVVFAAIIGAAFMGEAFGRRRILGAAVIALGIVLVNWPTP